MKKTIISGGRRGGKTEAMQKARADFLRKHPKATIVTVRNGETIVEKHVEELGPKLLTHGQSQKDNAAGP